MSSGELKSLMARTRETFLCYFEASKVTKCTSKLSEENLDIHIVVQKFSDIFPNPIGLAPKREGPYDSLDSWGQTSECETL